MNPPPAQPSPPFRQRAIQALERLFNDPASLLLELSPGELFCLIAAAQLACRHPHFRGVTRQMAEETARGLAGALLAHAAQDPDLALLLEQGWNSAFDEPQEPEQRIIIP
jgi:hypothetical protein